MTGRTKPTRGDLLAAKVLAEHARTLIADALSSLLPGRDAEIDAVRADLAAAGERVDGLIEGLKAEAAKRERAK